MFLKLQCYINSQRGQLWIQLKSVIERVNTQITIRMCGYCGDQLRRYSGSRTLLWPRSTRCYILQRQLVLLRKQLLQSPAIDVQQSNTVPAALVLQNEKQSRPDQEHCIDHTTRTPNETANTLLLHTALKMKNGADTKIAQARESLKFLSPIL